MFIISVAAELAGVHPQTLRIYERKGLVRPQRTSGNTRRYSQADIDRLLAIQELTDAGVNLAGVKRIIELRAEVDALQRRGARSCGPSSPTGARSRCRAGARTRSCRSQRVRGAVGGPAVTRLAGERVTLRPYRDDEADDPGGDVGRRRVVRAQGHGPRELAERVRERIRRSGSFTEGVVIFAIEAEGRLVGEVQARQPVNGLPPGVFELGIELFDDADRGRGLGAEAIVAITRHLFDDEAAHRVQLSTDVDNAAMRTGGRAARLHLRRRAARRSCRARRPARLRDVRDHERDDDDRTAR